ncbi:uncharacterized peptidase C1-like protein F26E4.3 [Onthophagus taurus]|uniref:uncharacterized peptidase C1-like protein F26E4.3 n=1 Tax=Onthophagus taurus TaxID=166361 RepID=UPI000C209BF9|nr:uncharacterized peptidase C1-like protein F26E4.3 [Onthophagus taurus]XP_022913751.1 uncharacterized peptidase C1-like protein F26E4.3 [Onthophagus taurus]XP_022913752.1 uncharacterized peptidase C1-like protein F26E4.3 [Onthophagus taurus]
MYGIQWLLTLLVISSLCVNEIHTVRPAFDLQGDYCLTKTGPRCCSGRMDACSRPILGTLCYCDDFCDSRKDEDCCPDYWSVCRNDPEPIVASCRYQNQVVEVNKSIKDNCNLCKCNLWNMTFAEILCEKHTCLIEPDVINTVNQHYARYGWTATNYTKFWGRKHEEGIRLRLGTKQPHRFVKRMNPVRLVYDPYTLPKEFDSDKTWPGYISGIIDQGWCGSSWALSTVAVASDRYAVISKGLEVVQLSAQHLLSCDNRGQQSCDGGHLDRAWNYFRKFGLVDNDCFPYKGTNEKCPFPRSGNLKTARCAQPTNEFRTDRYMVSPAHRVANESDIMYEIMHSGPVQATMKVYHDFFSYQGGIYKHTDLTDNDRTGYHSVRIVGWGEEYSYSGVQKYWKVANSWGTEWGENGYFRIVKGHNECEIETFVLGVIPLIQSEEMK